MSSGDQYLECLEDGGVDGRRGLRRSASRLRRGGDVRFLPWNGCGAGAHVPTGYEARVTPDETDHFVRVRGASEHNLRNVDVDIPRDAMVAFTGVSGSGKSSLAFGTLYAEAQRRYFESVAPYARRLLQQVGAPHVQEITGLPPAVALQQRRGAATSRSTVGTITTLSNLLRMLYSRAGDYPPGPTPGRRGVLAEHRRRRLPALPRAGCRARRDRGAARPGPVAEHPRRRDRGLAGCLAGRQPAQHRERSRHRHRQAVEQAARRRTGTGCCSPTSSRRC